MSFSVHESLSNIHLFIYYNNTYCSTIAFLVTTQVSHFTAYGLIGPKVNTAGIGKDTTLKSLGEVGYNIPLDYC